MKSGQSLSVNLKEYLLRRETMVALVVLLLLGYFLVSRGASMVLTILIEIAIFAVVTMSLNLEAGYTGISQFGRLIAVITGAIVVGAVPGRIMAGLMGLPAGADYALDTVNFQLVPQLTNYLAESWFLSIIFLLVCLLLAAVAGAGIGWLTSRPAIRLKESLGIFLLAIGDFIMWIGHNWVPLVGGSSGVFIPDPFRIVAGARFEAVVVTFFAIMLLVYFFVIKLTNSPFGRTLKMVRDNDISAAAAGKNIIKTRTQSLMIGSALAAIGGAMFVIYTGTTTAASFTRLTWTFYPWAFMMLGGIGSNLGVLLGVSIFAILRTMITIYRFQVFGFLLAMGIDPLWLEFTLVGAMIIIVILFMPQGLVPAKVEPVLPVNRVNRVLAGKQAVKTP